MNEDKLESLLKEYSLVERGLVEGQCVMCGNCCKVKNPLAYEHQTEGEHTYLKLIPNEDGYTGGNGSCLSLTENKCERHDTDKPIICKYWPYFKEELDIVNCKGFKYIGEDNEPKPK